MKSLMLSLLLLVFNNSFSQNIDSVQKDIQYSIEKVFYTSNQNVINKTAMFYLLIDVNYGVKEVKFSSTDSNYHYLFQTITLELDKRSSFKRQGKVKLLVPVFLISLENESLKISKEEFYDFMESFPTKNTEVRLMRRIILFSTKRTI
ncbi:MAG: hypothetical protein ABL872_05145 [Lacibacter sp.]